MDGWWAASYVVLWILVLFLCVIVVALARQIGTLHLRLGPRGALEIDEEGPPLGSAAPVVEGIARDGSRVAVGGPGRARLLLFASPDCMVCERVVPAVPVIARSARLEPLVIADVDPIETRNAYPPDAVDADVVSGVEVASQYAVPGTPYVIVVDEGGIVRAKGTVNNLEQLEGLVDTAVQRSTAAVAER